VDECAVLNWQTTLDWAVFAYLLLGGFVGLVRNWRNPLDHFWRHIDRAWRWRGGQHRVDRRGAVRIAASTALFAYAWQRASLSPVWGALATLGFIVLAAEILGPHAMRKAAVHVPAHQEYLATIAEGPFPSPNAISAARRRSRRDLSMLALVLALWIYSWRALWWS
jgi:hypothetical protein